MLATDVGGQSFALSSTNSLIVSPDPLYLIGDTLNVKAPQNKFPTTSTITHRWQTRFSYPK